METSSTFILITPLAVTRGLESDILTRFLRKGGDTKMTERFEVNLADLLPRVLGEMTHTMQRQVLERELNGGCVVYTITAPYAQLYPRIQAVVGHFTQAGSIRGDHAGSPDEYLVTWPAEMRIGQAIEQQIYTLLHAHRVLANSSTLRSYG